MGNWIDLCRNHIIKQIENLKNGRFKLHIPTIDQKYKYENGTHYHTTPEMSSQISGRRISSISPGQIFHVEPDDICLTPAMYPHRGRLQTEPNLFLVIAFEHFDLSLIRGEGLPGKLAHSTEILTVKTSKKESIKYYMNHIYDISKMDHNIRESALCGILLVFFSELLIILDESESNVMKNYNPHPKILKALSLIEANLGDSRLNVDFLSELIECSSGYLSQLFCRENGVKLSAYINKKRLERSEQLLKETNMSISEVAYTCGYTDPSYFIRIFRKQKGVTPMEYKKH